MLSIDGSFGEGGGQVLRTSLALSLVTGSAFRITNIRAGRKKPGLLQQHLTAVKAAARVGNARVTGAGLGSRELTFTPTGVFAGNYTFTVGTAGSATLVLQTVLPPLLTVSGPATLTLEGGTHNPFAPPFDFVDRVFLPVINRMGPRVSATLERPGFYPAGGGRFTVTIEPTAKLLRIDLLERGPIRRQFARAVVARLPRHIAERELAVIEEEMKSHPLQVQIEEASASRGPGNVVTIEIQSRDITEVFTGFGQRGVRAEEVADTVVGAARRYLEADVPVGVHLADQLLVPFAFAGGGTFKTLPPSEHTRTNIEVIEKFLDIRISLEQVAPQGWLVAVE